MGAKTFLVFFDWDKADLTARGEGIVRDAANYSTSAKYTRIDVAGNTETSGTPAYNQGLSERRARVVSAELVRDGVPQSAIAIHAYGDTKLLVPTGPGCVNHRTGGWRSCSTDRAGIGGEPPDGERLAVDRTVTCGMPGHDRRQPHPGGRGRRPPS